MFYKPLLLLAIFVCLCASANGQTVPKDAWMNYAQQMYSETTAPLPHYVVPRWYSAFASFRFGGGGVSCWVNWCFGRPRKR